MSPSRYDSRVTISIGLDLQDAYDQAKALQRLFEDQIAALEPKGAKLICEDCGEELNDELTIDVDASDVRSKALVMATAWAAAAESLERSGFVCTHPDWRRVEVDENLSICLECERAIPGDG